MIFRHVTDVAKQTHQDRAEGGRQGRGPQHYVRCADRFCNHIITLKLLDGMQYDAIKAEKKRGRLQETRIPLQ